MKEILINGATAFTVSLLLESKGTALHMGSLTERDLVELLTRACRRVYHRTAGVAKLNLARLAYWHVNVQGTRKVFEAAKK